MFASSTPSPVPPQPDTRAQQPPPSLAAHERLRLQEAAQRAKLLYPGVVGETLASEIEAARDMGWRLCQGTRMQRLAAHIMTAPLPASAA